MVTIWLVEDLFRSRIFKYQFDVDFEVLLIEFTVLFDTNKTVNSISKTFPRPS